MEFKLTIIVHLIPLLFLQYQAHFLPGTYAYIAVAQQSTEELSLARNDWFVSGIYYANGDTTQPGTMVIPDSTFVENINITVDFNNPPPQPPGYN